ncbi:hypothetical protein VA249_17170 [Vibrio alfacsensis]|uniref:hypothetical protein n=1 Tax=Vibrio alfacsensis TaxID=1074311 RepID=UPI001BF08C5E|nr:hypothetical protein [Vibrio alfacsensis]BBM65071.1 hypothetical protein VA249_17170 [Vibrio alfacsensis]
MTKIALPSIALISSLTAIPCALSAETTSPQSPWQHSVEIYMLALNINGDATMGNFSSSLDVDPKFIMDHIDIGAMARLEGVYQNKWGYYIDYSFMDLSGDVNNLSGLLPNVTYRADLEVRQGVLEAKAFQREVYSFGMIDYMFGLRWWDNDIKGKVYRNDNRILVDRLNIKDDWVDFLMGVRWLNDLTNNWRFHASLDAGLGADTRFTYATQIGLRYRMNDWSDINLAYKSTWVDYANEGTFEYDTASHGMLIGLGLYF